MFAGKIVEAVRSVIGGGPHALHEPLFIGNEQKYVADAIVSGWVAQGEYIERFEQMLCDFTGAKHAVATCSGTGALHAAYVARGLRPGVQTYAPSLTFIATINAIQQSGARISLYDELFFAPKGCAVVTTHLLGHIKNGFDKPEVIHDAAQALGSTYQSRGILIFSFNGNKIITTGGGGAILTDFKDVADKARHLITQARVTHPWKIEHDGAAFNYRMPNINAALGCAQMEQLPYILKAKRALAMQYKAAFDFDGVEFWDEPDGFTSNFWLNAILLDDSANQEPAMKALHDAGYYARLLPTPVHMLKPYTKCERSKMDHSEDLWRRTICLPSSPKLGVKYA